MLHDYQEIIYGLVLGLAAAALDTAMDARMEGHSFGAELGGHPGMLLYRAIFVVFGLIIGSLVWRNNRRKHNFRHLLEKIKRFHEQCEAQVLVLHSRLQVLLTKESLQLTPEAEQQIRAVYEKTRELQKVLGERPPIDDFL